MKPPKWITVYVCPKCERTQGIRGLCTSLCEVQTKPYWYQVHGPISGGTEA